MVVSAAGIRAAFRVPGNHVTQRLGRAEQVAPDHPRQLRSLAQEVEGAGHTRSLEHPMLGHQVIDKRQQDLVDEEAPFTCVIEISLRREERQCRQSLVAGPGQRRGGDSEQ
jgi:hypothetical protein